jgi:anti-anti-sigma factor
MTGNKITALIRKQSPMKLNTESLNNIQIVNIEGRLDTTNSGEFETYMNNILGSGCKNLLLDCSGLSYVSSSGLRVFLVVQKRMASSGGSFSICSLQPTIREIFEISGFTMIFSIFPDKASALAKSE